MSQFLYKACEECVADAGKEDDALVKRLHDYVHERFEKRGEPWTYELIDTLIDLWDKTKQ